MKMKQKVHIITGAPNVRKSSAIRALTGIYNSGDFNIQWLDSPSITEILSTSPNEFSTNTYPTGMTPQELIQWIKNKHEVTRFIFPLRSSSPLFHLPLAGDYIKALNAADIEVAPVAMFNTEVPLPNVVNGLLIENTTQIPSNALAHKIRKLWGLH
jgi:hypothetical protein